MGAVWLLVAAWSAWYVYVLDVFVCVQIKIHTLHADHSMILIALLESTPTHACTHAGHSMILKGLLTSTPTHACTYMQSIL